MCLRSPTTHVVCSPTTGTVCSPTTIVCCLEICSKSLVPTQSQLFVVMLSGALVSLVHPCTVCLHSGFFDTQSQCHICCCRLSDLVGADIGLHVGKNFLDSFPERVYPARVILKLNEVHGRSLYMPLVIPCHKA